MRSGSDRRAPAETGCEQPARRKVDWKGTTPFAGEVAQARTRQLSDEMIVTKEIVAGLLLAAGSKGFSGTGGGGSNSDLTNWDGTKKRSGWGR